MDIQVLKNKEEQIKELLKEHFETEIVSSIGLSSYLIFRDGTLVGAYRHRDMMDYLHEKGALTDEEIGEYDTTIFNEVFSCVRCSDYTNDENYIGITDEALTEAQYRVLKDWIDNNVEINRKGVQVTAHFASDNQSSVYYDYANIIKEGDWPSDYIIFKIKKYYSSGKLEEDIKPNEAGYPCIHIVTEDSELYQLSLEACTYLLENKEQFFSEEECKLLEGISAHPYMYYQVHTDGCPEEDGRLIINFDVDINPCPQKVVDFIKENAVEYKDWYKTNEDLKPEPAIISTNAVWHIVAGKNENSNLCMDVYFIPDKLKVNLWDIYVEGAVKERYGDEFDNTNLFNMRWIYLGSNSFMIENHLQIIFGRGSSYGPLDIPDDNEKIIEDTILSYGNIVDVDDEYWKDVLDNQIKGNPVYELTLYEDLKPILDTSNQVITGRRGSEGRITIDVSNMTDFKEYVAKELDLRHTLFNPLHTYDAAMNDTEHYKWLYYTYPGQINNNYGFINIRYFAGDDAGWVNVLGSNTFGFHPDQEWRDEIIRRTPEFADMLHEELRKSNIQELITILEKKGVDISSFFNIAESSSHLKTATDEQKKAYEEARKELSNIQTKCAVVGFYKGEPDPGSYIVWGISLEEAKSLSCRLLQEDMIHTQISKRTNTLVATRYRNAQDHNFDGFDADPESGSLVLIADSPTGDFIERGCSGWPKEKFYFSYNLYKEYDSPTDAEKFRELSLNEDLDLKPFEIRIPDDMVLINAKQYDILEEYFRHDFGKYIPWDQRMYFFIINKKKNKLTDGSGDYVLGLEDTPVTFTRIHRPNNDYINWIPPQSVDCWDNNRRDWILDKNITVDLYPVKMLKKNNNGTSYNAVSGAYVWINKDTRDKIMALKEDLKLNQNTAPNMLGYTVTPVDDSQISEELHSVTNLYIIPDGTLGKVLPSDEPEWYTSETDEVLDYADANCVQMWGSTDTFATDMDMVFIKFPTADLTDAQKATLRRIKPILVQVRRESDCEFSIYSSNRNNNNFKHAEFVFGDELPEDIKPNEIPAESWEKYLYFDSMLDRDDITVNNTGEVSQELIDKFRGDYCWFIKRYDGEDWTEDLNTYKFDAALKIFMEAELEPGDMIDVAFSASNLADYTEDRLDLTSWPGHTAYECDWLSVLSRDHNFNEVQQEDLQPKERALPDFDKNYGYGREEEEIEEFIYEHFEEKYWGVRVLTDDLEGPFKEKYLIENTDFFKAYDLFENTNTLTDDEFAGRTLSLCLDYRPNDEHNRYNSDGNNEYGLLVKSISSSVTEDLNLISRETASLPRGWNELNLKQVKWLIKFLKDKRSKKYYYVQYHGSMAWSVYRYDYYEAAGEYIESCLPEIESGDIKVCVDTNVHGYAVGRADGSPLHEVMLYKLKNDGTYKRWFSYHNIVVPESLIPGYLDEDLDLQSRKVEIDKYLYKPEVREYIDEFSREPRWVVMGIEVPEGSTSVKKYTVLSSSTHVMFDEAYDVFDTVDESKLAENGFNKLVLMCRLPGSNTGFYRVLEKPLVKPESVDEDLTPVAQEIYYDRNYLIPDDGIFRPDNDDEYHLVRYPVPVGNDTYTISEIINNFAEDDVWRVCSHSSSNLGNGGLYSSHSDNENMSFEDAYDLFINFENVYRGGKAKYVTVLFIYDNYCTPVLVRECDWEEPVFEDLTLEPADDKIIHYTQGIVGSHIVDDNNVAEWFTIGVRDAKTLFMKYRNAILNGRRFGIDSNFEGISDEDILNGEWFYIVHWPRRDDTVWNGLDYTLIIELEKGGIAIRDKSNSILDSIYQLDYVDVKRPAIVSEDIKPAAARDVTIHTYYPADETENRPQPFDCYKLSERVKDDLWNRFSEMIHAANLDNISDDDILDFTWYYFPLMFDGALLITDSNWTDSSIIVTNLLEQHPDLVDTIMNSQIVDGNINEDIKPQSNNFIVYSVVDRMDIREWFARQRAGDVFTIFAVDPDGNTFAVHNDYSLAAVTDADAPALPEDEVDILTSFLLDKCVTILPKGRADNSIWYSANTFDVFLPSFGESITSAQIDALYRDLDILDRFDTKIVNSHPEYSLNHFIRQCINARDMQSHQRVYLRDFDINRDSIDDPVQLEVDEDLQPKELSRGHYYNSEYATFGPDEDITIYSNENYDEVKMTLKEVIDVYGDEPIWCVVSYSNRYHNGGKVILRDVTFDEAWDTFETYDFDNGERDYCIIDVPDNPSNPRGANWILFIRNRPGTQHEDLDLHPEDIPDYKNNTYVHINYGGVCDPEKAITDHHLDEVWCLDEELSIDVSYKGFADELPEGYNGFFTFNEAYKKFLEFKNTHDKEVILHLCCKTPTDDGYEGIWSILYRYIEGRTVAENLDLNATDDLNVENATSMTTERFRIDSESLKKKLLDVVGFPGDPADYVIFMESNDFDIYKERDNIPGVYHHYGVIFCPDELKNDILNNTVRNDIISYYSPRNMHEDLDPQEVVSDNQCYYYRSSSPGYLSYWLIPEENIALKEKFLTLLKEIAERNGNNIEYNKYRPMTADDIEAIRNDDETMFKEWGIYNITGGGREHTPGLKVWAWNLEKINSSEYEGEDAYAQTETVILFVFINKEVDTITKFLEQNTTEKINEDLRPKPEEPLKFRTDDWFLGPSDEARQITRSEYIEQYKDERAWCLYVEMKDENRGPYFLYNSSPFDTIFREFQRYSNKDAKRVSIMLKKHGDPLIITRDLTDDVNEDLQQPEFSHAEVHENNRDADVFLRISDKEYADFCKITEKDFDEYATNPEAHFDFWLYIDGDMFGNLGYNLVSPASGKYVWSMHIRPDLTIDDPEEKEYNDKTIEKGLAIDKLFGMGVCQRFLDHRENVTEDIQAKPAIKNTDDENREIFHQFLEDNLPGTPGDVREWNNMLFIGFDNTTLDTGFEFVDDEVLYLYIHDPEGDSGDRFWQALVDNDEQTLSELSPDLDVANTLPVKEMMYYVGAQWGITKGDVDDWIRNNNIPVTD